MHLNVGVAGAETPYAMPRQDGWRSVPR